MNLVERDEQLTTLDRLLAEAMAGHGRIAVVRGAVGTGKSALLDVFAERAADAGASVLSAVCSEAESGLRAGVLRQLLRGVQMPSGEGDRLAGFAAAAGTAEADLVEEVCQTVFDAAERHPLALIVDDAQWADPVSSRCLSSVARRVRNSRVVLVTAEPDPPSALRLELFRSPFAHLVPVGLLSPDGVRRLAEGTAHGQGPDDLYETAGGNPLIVTALLRSEDPGAALLSCLRRCGPGPRDAAAALAVLGVPDAIDRLLDRDPAETAAALRSLETAGLLAGGRFRRASARDAVLLDLGTDRRVELHSRAADLAFEDGASASVVAGHLLAARRTPRPWAVPVLETAALEALADGNTNPAIGYLRLACSACEDDGDLARIRTTLLRAQWRIDPSTPAARLTELAEAQHRGFLRGSDALVLTRALLWHGRFDDARDILTRLSESDAFADPETLTELRNTHPWLRCSYTPFLDFLPPPGTAEPDSSSLATGHRLEAATALDTVLTRGPSEQVVAEAERILRNARLDELGMDTVESALLALTYGGRPDRAAPWCDGLLEDAVHRQAPSRHARLSTIRAEISFREGDLSAAERHARHALDTIPAGGWGVTLGSSLASLLLPLLAMGRDDLALEALERPVPQGILQSRYGLHYLQARGRCRLATGRAEAALGDFQACGELMEQWGLDAPGLIAWRLDAAEARLATGDRDEARRLLEEQLRRCGHGALRTQGITLRMLAATFETRHRPALLRQATAVLEAAGDRYELARALTDLTTAYRDLGEPRRASVIGRRAWNLARECHAVPLSRLLALDDLPDDGSANGSGDATDPASGGPAAVQLSDAERRVVRLAAGGLTNREIAKRLYVTVSTVEQHLTRAYRKLNVASRADLPTALESV